MWRSPHLSDILPGSQDVQRLILLEKQVDRICFICAFESPFPLACAATCPAQQRCKEAWELAWRITFAPNLAQRDLPMSLLSFAERILLRSSTKETGLCTACQSSMLRSVRNDLQCAQNTGLTASNGRTSYFGQEYALLLSKMDEFCTIYPAPHWTEPKRIT